MGPGKLRTGTDHTLCSHIGQWDRLRHLTSSSDLLVYLYQR